MSSTAGVLNALAQRFLKFSNPPTMHQIEIAALKCTL